MKLTNLQISIIPSYRSNKGNYEGKVEFADDQGSITLTLSHELSQRVLDVIGEVLIDTSKQLATKLTMRIVEQQIMALEEKQEEAL